MCSCVACKRAAVSIHYANYVFLIHRKACTFPQKSTSLQYKYKEKYTHTKICILWKGSSSFQACNTVTFSYFENVEDLKVF